MTTYEGGVRVISMLRWPKVIQPGKILNGIQGHQDMFTSFSAAAGVDNVAELMRYHLETLEKYPPVQGGKSFDMSNVIEEFSYTEITDLLSARLLFCLTSSLHKRLYLTLLKILLFQDEVSLFEIK